MKAADEPTMLKATLGLALAGLVLFGASLNDPFHFDDALFLNDSNVTNPARWHHFLNPLHLRQLTFFTFYVNHILSGTNAGTYHALNVGLHIANAILFFMLLNKWVDRRIAWIAAAVFPVLVPIRFRHRLCPDHVIGQPPFSGGPLDDLVGGASEISCDPAEELGVVFHARVAQRDK